ncbi:FlgK family flagellar hook-associated protein [Oscillibacter sp.]|uniref:flagellar hook-associated protein FlgK n=1 Tax=Oscillibacter sp. TaxID=1945593 RepID=UPI0028AD53CB|nr:flagellar basal body rod C-terminal domain-containing protein [Oscillibacter sp.]
MLSTTFGAFTTARLGIYAAQKALEVTGHNISNINTNGYTRQRVDQVSLRVGGVDRYASAFGGASGSGVLITGMSQFRDPYLDIRFRNENSSVGAMDTKLSGLEELAAILDEVGKGDIGEEGEGILAARFQDLRDMLSKLTGDQTTEEEMLSLARTSADALVGILRSYAERIAGVKEDQADGLTNDVAAVNDILKSIQSLNENIQKSELYGDNSLELRDQRNVLIDKLSGYMKIDVTYEPVSVGAGRTVDKLVIKVAGDPPTKLVDGTYVGQLSVGDGLQKNPNYAPNAAPPVLEPYLDASGTPVTDPAAAALLPYAITVSELKDRNDVVLKEKNGSVSEAYQFGDTELYGGLQARRELLTEAGEFASADMTAADSDSATKRGIPYYQKALDSLAQKLASVMNAANTGYLQDTNGNIITPGSDPVEKIITKDAGGTYSYYDAATTTTTTRDTLDELVSALSGDATFNTKLDKCKLGGNLFSSSGSSDDASGITAANISISSSWSLSASFLQNSFEALEGKATVGSSDNRNIVHIMAEFDKTQEYKPGGNASPGKPFFRGTFEGMFTNIERTLADDVKSTTTLLNNYTVSATGLETGRDSVSGVDLNDEAMNMMQFQKSYAAACRLMTTLDEVLDKLINGTGVVGR